MYIRQPLLPLPLPLALALALNPALALVLVHVVVISILWRYSQQVFSLSPHPQLKPNHLLGMASLHSKPHLQLSFSEHG